MVLGLFHALLDSHMSENSEKGINCSSTWAPIFSFISRAKKTKTGKTQQQQQTTTTKKYNNKTSLILGIGMQMNTKASHFASKSLILQQKHMPFKNIAEHL